MNSSIVKPGGSEWERAKDLGTMAQCSGLTSWSAIKETMSTSMCRGARGSHQRLCQTMKEGPQLRKISCCARRSVGVIKLVLAAAV